MEIQLFPRYVWVVWDQVFGLVHMRNISRLLQIMFGQEHLYRIRPEGHQAGPQPLPRWRPKRPTRFHLHGFQDKPKAALGPIVLSIEMYASQRSTGQSFNCLNFVFGATLCDFSLLTFCLGLLWNAHFVCRPFGARVVHFRLMLIIDFLYCPFQAYVVHLDIMLSISDYVVPILDNIIMLSKMDNIGTSGYGPTCVRSR